MRRTAVALAVLGILIAYVHPTLAQQIATVGDVLKAGGKKLTGAEVQKLYSGATVSGSQLGKPEVTFKNQYFANDTVLGTAWVNGASPQTVSGTWSVNDAGQFCNVLAHGKINICAYVFSLGAKYYSALTGDQSAQVYERQFTR